MLDVAGPSEQLHEVLVVCDDQQLEVTLAGATLDDSGGERAERRRFRVTVLVHTTRKQPHACCRCRAFIGSSVIAALKPKRGGRLSRLES